MWQFTALAYARQGAENSGYATDAFIDRLVADAGLKNLDAGAADEGDGYDVRLDVVQSAEMRVRRRGLARCTRALKRVEHGADRGGADPDRCGYELDHLVQPNSPVEYVPSASERWMTS